MLIGIDWDGAKVEGVALKPSGEEIKRIRVETPHSSPDTRPGS